MSSYKGNSLITPVGGPSEWRWQRGSGPARQVFYEGPFEVLEGIAYDTLMDEFDSIIIRPKNGVGEWYRMEAAQNGEDVAEDYEVDGSSLTQNTLTNLNIKASYVAAGGVESDYASIFSQTSSEVRKAQNGQQTYQELSAAVLALLPDPTSPSRQVVFDFMDDLYRYGDQFLNSQYCFRRTITVADRVFINNNAFFADTFDNTNRIFTEAQLRATENVPNEFWLPKSIVDNSVSAEWLKMPSRTRYTIGHQRTIVREYLFADSWSRLKYGVKV